MYYRYINYQQRSSFTFTEVSGGKCNWFSWVEISIVRPICCPTKTNLLICFVWFYLQESITICKLPNFLSFDDQHTAIIALTRLFPKFLISTSLALTSQNKAS